VRVLALAVVYLLAAEVAGNLGYLLLHRQVFYWRPLAAPEVLPDAAPALSKLVLHPTLGFIRRPGLPMQRFAEEDRLDALAGGGARPEWADLRANNFGFFAPEAFPSDRHPAEFTVGVFGGSLAQWLVLQGGAVLRDELAKLPAVRGRLVRVVNFAQGGFKQPQQLFALTYFLSRGQPLDLAINVDGFNEVALARTNAEQGIEPTLPSASQLLRIAALMSSDGTDTAALEAVAEEVAAERRVRLVEDRAARTRFAAAWLWSRIEFAAAHRRLLGARATLEARSGRSPSLLHLNPLEAEATPEGAVVRAVDQWAECSAMMAALLSARGIAYLHVVQPNQYWSDHPFSEQERRLALNPRSPYREGVRLGYPKLLENLEGLQDRGVAAISAAGMFDREARAVYADDCCHLNQLGNEMLASYVAAAAPSALRTPGVASDAPEATAGERRPSPSSHGR
jgi:hypothetical protein